MTDDQTPEQAAAELAEARAHLAAMEEKCRAFLVARQPADLKGTPAQCGPAVTAEALEKHADRVRFFCDAIADDPDGDMAGRWHEVISQETAFLVEEGPAAYLCYLARLDEAAVRAEVDRFLDDVFPGGGS